VDDFVWIADYSFSCNRLRALEEQVCRELEFRLSCVTPHHFVNLFLRASNACPNGSCEFDHPVLRQVVMYLLALSRLSYHLSMCKPSLLAAAAVYLARATVGIRESDPNHSVHPEGYWTRTLEHFTSYKSEDLRGAVLIIHRYQLFAETAENIKGLFTKFSKSSHHFASLKTAVRCGAGARSFVNRNSNVRLSPTGSFSLPTSSLTCDWQVRVEDLGFETRLTHDHMEFQAIADEPI
jgi:Cyclin, C-terminal domain